VEDRLLELADLDGPVVGELVLPPRVEQRHGAAGAVGVPHERVGELGREGVAVEAEAGATHFEAVLEAVVVPVVAGVLFEVGDVAELELDRGLQHEVPVVAFNEKALVVARSEPAGGGEDRAAATFGVLEHRVDVARRGRRGRRTCVALLRCGFERVHSFLQRPQLFAQLLGGLVLGPRRVAGPGFSCQGGSEHDGGGDADEGGSGFPVHGRSSCCSW
jgi:hypothetical protein